MLSSALTLLSLPLLSLALAPNVTTSHGTWVGSSISGVENFLGIPYAQASRLFIKIISFCTTADLDFYYKPVQPPIGQLRFAPPLAATKQYGVVDATQYGNACPQMSSTDQADPYAYANLTQAAFYYLSLGPQTPANTTYGEDCLTVNVQRPVGTTKKSGLPVMVWIYGGAFIAGSSPTYNGSSLVTRSMTNNQDIIFVSMNYRLNSFGFLPGKEVVADPSTSTNAGLLDQRFALRWVQDNIAAFGGDKNRVTLFGESAGAISVGFQMTAYGGDIKYNGGTLFQAAIMESGAPYSSRGAPAAQNSFDVIANATGCLGVAQPIACLRNVSYTDLLAATSTPRFFLSLPRTSLTKAAFVFLFSPDLLPSFEGLQSVAIPFGPRTDGKLIPEYASKLIAAHKYAKVPMLSGNQYDEGTDLTWGTKSLKTTALVSHWLATIWAPGSSPAIRKQLLQLYTADPAVGSPFDTGLESNFTGQNKRISAIVGDQVFQAPRRYFLKYASKTQPVWSYVSRAYQTVANLGSYHGSDLISIFGGGGAQTPLTIEMQSRWINFANTLNPNINGYPHWPPYGSAKNLLQFSDIANSTVVPDTYRAGPIEFFSANEKYFIR